MVVLAFSWNFKEPEDPTRGTESGSSLRLGKIGGKEIRRRAEDFLPILGIGSHLRSARSPLPTRRKARRMGHPAIKGAPGDDAESHARCLYHMPPRPRRSLRLAQIFQPAAHDLFHAFRGDAMVVLLRERMVGVFNLKVWTHAGLLRMHLHLDVLDFSVFRYPV